MIVVETVEALRTHVRQARQAGRRVGLVPTMGNLHAGHIQLIHTARSVSNFVVATIFVNPMQFGANEDLDKYPRTLEADREKLTAAQCDLLFLPSVAEMYPNGMTGQTRITVPGVSEGLCGASRPGHFEGVATVVNKLFNMVQPDTAIFGEKDFQQLAVIRKMVSDLNLPIEIVGQPTVRADDHLALSSRNGYLDAGQRTQAPELYRQLEAFADAIRQGDESPARVIERTLGSLEAAGFRMDYLELRHPVTLQPATEDDDELVVLVAAYLGNTRLIDNLRFRRD
ncbi:pantoate--beta-alanine ligase [Pseudomonas sp. Marseille-QA0892]